MSNNLLENKVKVFKYNKLPIIKNESNVIIQSKVFVLDSQKDKLFFNN